MSLRPEVADSLGRSIGLRLEEAIAIARLNNAAFLRKMKKTGIRGAKAENTLRAYLEGRTVPSVEYLMAAADACAVRPEWLITGSGAPTVTEHIAMVSRANLRPLSKVIKAMLSEFPLARPPNPLGALGGGRGGLYLDG